MVPPHMQAVPKHSSFEHIRAAVESLASVILGRALPDILTRAACQKLRNVQHRTRGIATLSHLVAKMIHYRITRFVVVLLFSAAALAAGGAAAEDLSLAGKQLKVAMRVVPPFVIKKDAALTGFSFDLWTALAEATGATSETVEVPTLPELLSAVKEHKADLAIAAISITSRREEEFDFSQPMFDSGLQVLARVSGDSGGLTFASIARIASSGPILGTLGILAGLILAAAHIVWLFDRRKHEEVRSYFPGIFHSMYWATGAIGGQQPFHPHSAFGRLLGALCVFISIIFVAYFTAAVTSAMTVEQLRSDINGPEDLPGKTVATVAGSTSSAYLKGARLNYTEYGKISEAFDALVAKRADAVVFDAPVLLYFAANEGKGKVNVAGPVFRREAYGILFPQGSPLRKPVNEALLKLREKGLYDEIYRKWFGAPPGGG